MPVQECAVLAPGGGRDTPSHKGASVAARRVVETDGAPQRSRRMASLAAGGSTPRDARQATGSCSQNPTAGVRRGVKVGFGAVGLQPGFEWGERPRLRLVTTHHHHPSLRFGVPCPLRCRQRSDPAAEAGGCGGGEVLPQGGPSRQRGAGSPIWVARHPERERPSRCQTVRWSCLVSSVLACAWASRGAFEPVCGLGGLARGQGCSCVS